MVSLPNNRPLNELDIHYHVNRLKIKHFRGIYMRDSLPRKPHRNECGIVNLDLESGPGTHWIAYCKRGNTVYYFDSFGDLQPPEELLNYFGSRCKIYFNYFNYQNYGTITCGHLCIKFLHHFNKHYFE